MQLLALSCRCGVYPVCRSRAGFHVAHAVPLLPALKLIGPTHWLQFCAYVSTPSWPPVSESSVTHTARIVASPSTERHQQTAWEALESRLANPDDLLQPSSTSGNTSTDADGVMHDEVLDNGRMKEGMVGDNRMTNEGMTGRGMNVKRQWQHASVLLFDWRPAMRRLVHAADGTHALGQDELWQCITAMTAAATSQRLGFSTLGATIWAVGTLVKQNRLPVDGEKHRDIEMLARTVDTSAEMQLYSKKHRPGGTFTPSVHALSQMLAAFHFLGWCPTPQLLRLTLDELTPRLDTMGLRAWPLMLHDVLHCAKDRLAAEDLEPLVHFAQRQLAILSAGQLRATAEAAAKYQHLLSPLFKQDLIKAALSQQDVLHAPSCKPWFTLLGRLDGYKGAGFASELAVVAQSRLQEYGLLELGYLAWALAKFGGCETQSPGRMADDDAQQPLPVEPFFFDKVVAAGQGKMSEADSDSCYAWFAAIKIAPGMFRREFVAQLGVAATPHLGSLKVKPLLNILQALVVSGCKPPPTTVRSICDAVRAAIPSAHPDSRGHMMVAVARMGSPVLLAGAWNDAVTAFCASPASYSERSIGTLLAALAAVNFKVQPGTVVQLLHALLPQLDETSGALYRRVVQALAHSGCDVPREIQAELLAVAGRKLPTFEAVDFGLVMWAFAKLKWNVPAAFVADVVAATGPRLTEFAPSSLSNLSWALCRLKHTPSPEFVASFVAAVQPKLNGFIPAGFTNVLWPLGMWRYRASAEFTNAFVAAVEPQLIDFKAREVCALLRSGAKVMDLPADFVATMLRLAEGRVRNLNAQDVVDIMDALRTLKCEVPVGLRKGLVAAMTHALPWFKSSQLELVVDAYMALPEFHRDRAVTHKLLHAVRKQAKSDPKWVGLRGAEAALGKLLADVKFQVDASSVKVHEDASVV